MDTEPKLVAEKRTELGSANSRRLRKRGVIPGNVYGHQQEPVPIAVSEEVLSEIVHGGLKVIDLELEGASQKTIFREVQWDTFGRNIQHFDLIRISADERVSVEITVELRGIAPGTSNGGMLTQPLRSLRIECLAVEIPESIPVSIGELDVGDSIHVKDIQLPAGATVENPPEAVVVQIVRIAEELEEEDEAEELAAAEPEVIGRKTEEAEGESGE